MNRPRTIRALRIAWSVSWGIVAVLLFAVWVRSFAWDGVAFCKFGDSKTLMFRSIQGEVEVSTGFLTDAGAFALRVNPQVTRPSQPTWSYSVVRQRTSVRFPMWFPTLLAGTFFIVPIGGIVRRFSLRTLLIATTIIAVGLGLIAWLR
jgi:hypothetical protein